MLDKLININEKLLLINKNNDLELRKHTLIKELLQDKKLFFKLDIETSYAILRDLGFEEDELKTIYSELISAKNL